MNHLKKLTNSIKQSNRTNWWLYAFLLGALVFFLILSYSQVAFGRFLFVNGDGLDIYPAILSDVRGSILSLQNPFFSWSNNLGMNTSAYVAFDGRLLSPTFILSLLFPQSASMVALMLSMIIKAGLACMTFQIYAHRYLNKNKLLCLIISLCYSLCAFQVSMNITNDIWMDSLWLLPLILYFINTFIESGRFIPLTICYAYCFIINCYMGYVIGMFSFLYFVTKLIMTHINSRSHCAAFLSTNDLHRSHKTDIKSDNYTDPTTMTSDSSLHSATKLTSSYAMQNNQSDSNHNSSIIIMLARYILCVTLAFGLSAFIILPSAYFIFTHPVGDETTQSALHINIFDIINQLFIGENNSARPIFPYIYCGIISFIMLPCFFISKVTRSDKVVYALGLVIMAISSLVTPMYLFWHAFNAPDGWGYRYAFIISFIICSIACKALNHITDIKKWMLIVIGLLYIAFFIIMHFAQQRYDALYQSNDLKYLIINAMFIILTIVLIILYQCFNSHPKFGSAIAALMILCVSLELITNGYAAFYHNEAILPEVFTSTYYQWVRGTHDSIDLIEEDCPDDFYRITATGDYSINSDAFFGYAGTGDFGSIENPTLRATLRRLGIYTSPRVILPYGYTDFTNMLLGVKYRIKHAPYNEFSADSGFVNTVNKLDTYIGLGFLVDTKTKDLSVAGSDAFDNINRLASAMIDKEATLYEHIPLGDISLHEEGISVSYNDNGALLTADASSTINQLMVTVPASDRQAYIRFAYGDFSFLLYKAPQLMGGIENLREQRGLLSVPYIKPMFLEGDAYNVVIQMNPDTADMFYLPSITASYYNKDAFDEVYDTLSKHKLIVNDYRNGYVHGSIDCPTDSSLLFTSIPYDEGWQVYVNGTKRDITPLVDDAFIGVELDSGANDIEFVFTVPFLRVGVIITLISIVCVGVVLIFSRRKAYKAEVL